MNEPLAVSVEALERVRVAGVRRGAVVQHDRPVERRGRQGAVLGIGRRARELDRLVRRPLERRRQGESIDAVGGPLPAVIVSVSMSKAVPVSVTFRRGW